MCFDIINGLFFSSYLLLRYLKKMTAEIEDCVFKKNTEQN